MNYKDDIYGDLIFKEKVLIDLINTDLLGRLKKVNQGGPFDLLNPTHRWRNINITRFDHSVGVCILLKKLNSSLEEQIAGLLHDVSHTVFSHALDFLFNRGSQHDYHELFHDKMILNSKVPYILEKHGFDVDDILDEKKFTILERELPDLCADRIDYSFRSMVEHKRIPGKNVNDMLNSLIVHNQEIMFSDRNQAKIFSNRYIMENKLTWCTPEQSSLFHLISELMKIAIDKDIIDKEDVFTTDDNVINKLRKSEDKEIKERLDLIYNMEVIEDKDDYDFHLKSKVRWVDPKIIIDNKISRLSELDKNYAQKMNDFIDNRYKGFFVKIRKKN
jgi:hypothetical protein